MNGNNGNLNHNLPDAKAVESIMAKIYGEESAHEKSFADESVFDAEIESFSEVRRAIRAWRDAEFASLETPRIEIPELLAANDAQVSTVIAEKVSRTEKLRAFFTFSSPFATGATALAALAICAALLFVFVGNRNPETARSSTIAKPSLVSSPTSEPTPQPEEKKSEVSQTAASGETPNMKPQTSENKPVAAASETPAASRKTNSTAKSAEVVQVKNNAPLRPSGKRQANRPARNQNKNADLRDVENGMREILSKDNDDDSISLLDLFSEIDSK